MAEEHLMTVEEFNQAVRDWTLRVKSLTKQTLDSNTKATGHLSNYPTYLDRENYDSPYYKIKFHFERYGIGILKRNYFGEKLRKCWRMVM